MTSVCHLLFALAPAIRGEVLYDRHRQNPGFTHFCSGCSPARSPAIVLKLSALTFLFQHLVNSVIGGPLVYHNDVCSVVSDMD